MSLQIRYILLILFILFIGSAIEFAQINNLDEIGKPLIYYFSPKDYKSGPRNWSITQDSRGIMYFGNGSGILEYDGNNWRKIEVPGNQSVRSIITDKSGRVYVCAGTDFGYLAADSIGQLKFNSLLPFLDEQHKNLGEIWDVAASSEGVYFKTKSEILKWNGNKFTVWDSVYAFRLYNINDTIYSRNDGIGLVHVDGDSLKLMPDCEFFSSIGVYNMIPYKKNAEGRTVSILVTTKSDGLYIQKNNRFIPFKTEADNYLKDNQLYNTTISSENNIAFATQRGGVVVINDKGKLLKIVDENAGLKTNVCFDVYSDKNDGLWIASDFGINYFKESGTLDF